MEKNVSRAVNQLISAVMETDEYKKCIALKKKMNKNSEIMSLIERVKELQKKYVKSLDDDVKKELDEVLERLNNMPLYNSYIRNLDKVNLNINVIRDELNNYFDKVINE